MDLYNKFKVGPYSFTLIEIRDLIISAMVLAFIFSVALEGFEFTTITSAIRNFFIALFIVGPTLIFHELAHKFTAQRYGCKAHYVMWPTGVLMSLLLTFLSGGTIIFAALGAVMISTYYPTRVGFRFIGLTSEEFGKISASGPATNIALAIIFALLKPLNPTIMSIAVNINLIVALFNLIPFPPLDGAKIFGWSKIVWSGMLSSALILLFLPPVIGFFFSLLVAILIFIALFIIINYFAGWKPPLVEYR